MFSFPKLPSSLLSVYSDVTFNACECVLNETGNFLIQRNRFNKKMFCHLQNVQNSVVHLDVNSKR
jgi:hypothetical protein